MVVNVFAGWNLREGKSVCKQMICASCKQYLQKTDFSHPFSRGMDLLRRQVMISMAGAGIALPLHKDCTVYLAERFQYFVTSTDSGSPSLDGRGLGGG